MPDGGALTGIAHAIQLAIAPVFLLTGIASLLGVMANRLARVIDRGRVLEQSWIAYDERKRRDARRELDVLEQRRRLASASISARPPRCSSASSSPCCSSTR